MQQKTSRIAYLDVLKGVSMLLVIYCHGVLLPYHSVVGNLMMTLAWGAVPCFVMASGAVLHQSRHFAWKKHGKRVGGMYVTLVCWRLLYLVVYRLAGKTTGISLWESIRYLFFLQDYEGVDTGLMWYMIAYLGLMIVYPITYFLFTGGTLGKQIAFFVMLLSGLTGILFPSIDWLVRQITHRSGLPLEAWNSILTFGNNTNLLFYFLLGAFFLEYQNYSDKGKYDWIYKRRLPLSGLCLVIGLMGLEFVKYRETGLLIWGDTYLGFGYVRLSTALIAIGLYGLCESLFSERENLATKIIGECIGQNTLGIYYLHYILLAVFSWTTCFPWLQSHYFIGMNLIKAFVVAFVCYVVVCLVSKVPLIRKMVS